MDSHGHGYVPWDRISNLPEGITESILCRLPIQDAVKTSILSRDWRHKWTTLSHLVFDVSTFSPQLQDEGKLVAMISSILLRHKGPISKFSLSVKSMTNYSIIHQWLQFLFNNGAVTEFILEFIDGSGSGGGSQYQIHSSLFSCANLRHLKLQSCILPSPPPPAIFNGFNNLTSLDLKSVTFNKEGFENLIDKCPLLRSLHVQLCRVDGADRKLNIYAPKLECLLFCGNLNINKIYLRSIPGLLYVIFSPPLLPFMYHNDARIYIGNGESINVKTELGLRLALLFQDRMFEDMSSALRWITSDPNLVKLFVIALAINPSAAQIEAITEHLEVISGSIATLMRLRHVEMYNIKGLGPEMQFIKMILGKSPLLMQMKIQLAQSVRLCRDTESKILKELRRFPRASTMAEIIFQDNHVTEVRDDQLSLV